MCILCLLLVVFLCVTDWLGFSLIRGNPLPESVQTWINKHPESTICGEVVRCQENEETQSVYLKNTYLIYNSEKVSIDNVKVYLQQKKYNTDKKDNHNKLLAGSLVFMSGKLEEIESPRNPGEFDSKQYYACQHIYYVMKKGKIKKFYGFVKHFAGNFRGFGFHLAMRKRPGRRSRFRSSSSGCSPCTLEIRRVWRRCLITSYMRQSGKTWRYCLPGDGKAAALRS